MISKYTLDFISPIDPKDYRQELKYINQCELEYLKPVSKPKPVNKISGNITYKIK